MALRFIILFSIVFISCKNNKTEKEEVNTKTDSIVLTPSITKKKIEKPEPVFDSYITKDFILGKFNYNKHSRFVKLDAQHSSKAMFLDTEVYSAFKKMRASAKQSGVTLTAISGTRNFYAQKGIWERKWKKYEALAPLDRAKKILEYSSMPSTSRHHWGTDMDINNLNNSYFEKGKGKKEYDWLVENANSFGFYQVYTNKKGGRTGYNLEKWHWSYLPLASKYLKFYNKNITYTDINGFKGSELAKEVKMIENYVNGIAVVAKEY